MSNARKPLFMEAGVIVISDSDASDDDWRNYINDGRNYNNEDDDVIFISITKPMRNGPVVEPAIELPEPVLPSVHEEREIHQKFLENESELFF